MKKKKDEKKNLAIEDLTLKPFLHEDHKMPKTRREFMAHGFYGITTTMVLPSFASMVLSQNEAYAQTVACELPQFSAGLPYLCIDVAGGMNIPGANVMVGMAANGEHQEDYGSGGNDYLRLGIVSGEHPLAATTIVNGKLESDKVEKKYGLKFHRASGVLEGMKSVLDGQMMPNGRPIEDGIDGLVFCTRTSDDTAANPINTVYMANKAGAKGELVQLVGNSSTDTGARSAAPGGEINLNLRPSLVARNSDAEGLLSLGGTMGSAAYLNSAGSGGEERVKSFMDRIAKMSKSKVRDLAKKNSLGQIQDVLNCSLDGAKQLFNTYSADMLNPDNDATVTAAFAGTDERVASVAKLVLDSIAGAGSITIGGADYHGGTAVNTHAKDTEVGRAIGKCILLAKEKGKNLALHIYTDGGVSGDSGGLSEPVAVLDVGQVSKVKWTGDSGTRSAAMLIFYKHDHDGSSMVREDTNGPRRQVGNFEKKGGVNLNTIIGNSTENLWKAIMLNYLAAQGKEGQFSDIFGLGTLPAEYETLIRMKNIIG